MEEIKEIIKEVFSNLDGSKLIAQKIFLYFISGFTMLIFILFLKIYYFVRL